MYTYAVGDIHGCRDKMERALAKIEGHGSVDGGTVVFLGDYVDRGPDSAGVVERLRQGPPRGWAWIKLRGNHEDMMIDAMASAYSNLPALRHWTGNGGDKTLACYPEDDGGEGAHLDACWLRDNTIPVYADAHRVYVHAAVDETREIEEQSEHVMRWHRYGDREDRGYRGKHVVHGHTPVKEPLLLKNRTNLDTGACFGAQGYGVLSVGVFNDAGSGGPVAVWSFC